MVDTRVDTAVRVRPAQTEATAWTQLRSSRNWLGFWYMMPAVLILGLFLAWPLILGIWLSFTDTKIGRPGVFIGLENYEWLYGDTIFWLSVFNTVLYTTVASVIKFALGLYLALLLNKHLPFKALIRAAVLIPFIVPTVLSAIAFWWLYDAQFSILSWMLKKMGLITQNIDFLGDPNNARASVIFANIWRGIPFIAITLLAGLQTVSPSLYEAATLDGASKWQLIPPHHLSAADPDHRGGDDLLGAVHVHGLPADLGDDARWTGELDAPDGDVVLSTRDHRRAARRRCGNFDSDDPVPAGSHHGLLVRAPAAQVAARWQQ